MTSYIDILTPDAVAVPKRGFGQRYAAALRLSGRVIWADRADLFTGPGAREDAVYEARRVLHHCDPGSLMAEQLQAVCDGQLERVP